MLRIAISACLPFALCAACGSGNTTRTSEAGTGANAPSAESGTGAGTSSPSGDDADTDTGADTADSTHRETDEALCAGVADPDMGQSSVSGDADLFPALAALRAAGSESTALVANETVTGATPPHDVWINLESKLTPQSAGPVAGGFAVRWDASQGQSLVEGTTYRPTPGDGFEAYLVTDGAMTRGTLVDVTFESVPTDAGEHFSVTAAALFEIIPKGGAPSDENPRACIKAHIQGDATKRGSSP